MPETINEELVEAVKLAIAREDTKRPIRQGGSTITAEQMLEREGYSDLIDRFARAIIPIVEKNTLERAAEVAEAHRVRAHQTPSGGSAVYAAGLKGEQIAASAINRAIRSLKGKG